MFSLKERYFNTIKEIEYSDGYEANIDLFEKGIDILNHRIKEEDYSEFSDEERDVLEEVFTIMECCGEG